MTMGEFWEDVVRGNGDPVTAGTSRRHVNQVLPAKVFIEGPLRFGPGMGLVLGASIGTESMRAALFDANGDVVEVSTGGVGTPGEPGKRYHCLEAEPSQEQPSLDPASLLDRLRRLCFLVLEGALTDDALLIGGKLPLLGIAVAWPGPLSRGDKLPTGRALRHPEWTSKGAKSVLTHLSDAFGLEVERCHAINDANAAVLSVAFDQSRQPKENRGRLGETTLALRIAGGLGAGTVTLTGRQFDEDDPLAGRRSTFIHARLIEGTGGFAGELGHWLVPPEFVSEIVRRGRPHHDDPLEGLAPPPDLVCACRGKPGCLETFASVRAFIARMKASGIDIEGLESGGRARSSVMRRIMLAASDERQLRAQRDIGRLVGCSLSAPILMLNPASIWLSGALAVPEVKAGIEDEVERWKHVHRSTKPLRLELVSGPFATYAPARGAALAVFRGRVYRRLEDPTLLQGLTRPIDAEFVQALLT